MNPFSIGERVALKSCTGLLGTVTSFVRGRVEVRFDDCSHEAPRAFRPETLQRAEKQVPGA